VGMKCPGGSSSTRLTQPPLNSCELHVLIPFKGPLSEASGESRINCRRCSTAGPSSRYLGGGAPPALPCFGRAELPLCALDAPFNRGAQIRNYRWCPEPAWNEP
jgi:hypothetical protein